MNRALARDICSAVWLGGGCGMVAAPQHSTAQHTVQRSLQDVVNGQPIYIYIYIIF